MHFRVRRKVIQLIRTRYDNDSKRAVTDRVGTVPLTATALPEDVAALLTAEERLEFDEFLATRRRREELEDELAVHTLPESIDRVANWLRAPHNATAARPMLPRLTEAMQVLRRALREQSDQD